MGHTVELSTITSREHYARILRIAKSLICGDRVRNNTAMHMKPAMVIILNL
jgi:hypothetical protein